MSDWLTWIGKTVGMGLLAAYLVVMVVLLLLAVLSVPILRLLLLRERWRDVQALQKLLQPQRSVPVILCALALRDTARGRGYWPWKLAYGLLGASTQDQKKATDSSIQTWESLVHVVRLGTGGEVEGSTSPGFAVLFNELFPRWKACVLAGAMLAAVTVFVPPNVGLALFCFTTFFVAWRGYRDPKISKWGDFIRLGLIGGFVGTLLFSFLVQPIQRNGLVRLSRDVHPSSPQRFLCCIWDGQPPRAQPNRRP